MSGRGKYGTECLAKDAIRLLPLCSGYGEAMKTIIAFLTGHSHYFGTPHREGNGPLIQTCYSCGKTRRVKADLEVAP